MNRKPRDGLVAAEYAVLVTPVIWVVIWLLILLVAPTLALGR